MQHGEQPLLDRRFEVAVGERLQDGRGHVAIGVHYDGRHRAIGLRMQDDNILKATWHIDVHLAPGARFQPRHIPWEAREPAVVRAEGKPPRRAPMSGAMVLLVRPGHANAVLLCHRGGAGMTAET